MNYFKINETMNCINNGPLEKVQYFIILPKIDYISFIENSMPFVRPLLTYVDIILTFTPHNFCT